MTTECSQADAEAAEIDALDARKRFLAELARGPKSISDAYVQWQQSERHAFEARRARREAEVFDG